MVPSTPTVLIKKPITEGTEPQELDTWKKPIKVISFIAAITQ